MDDISTEKTTRVAAARGSSVAEGIIGLGAMTLAVIALANVMPVILLSIAIIAAGVALLFEAGTLSARYSRLKASGVDVTLRRGGTMLESISGIFVIALGIISLVGVVPRWLIPIALIIAGLSLLFSASTSARLNAVETVQSTTTEPSHEIVREAGISMISIQSILGFGVLTLGVLALIGVSSLILSLAAMLGLGGAMFLNSTASGAAASFSRK